jgi:hypothetical protein
VLQNLEARSKDISTSFMSAKSPGASPGEPHSITSKKHAYGRLTQVYANPTRACSQLPTSPNRSKVSPNQMHIWNLFIIFSKPQFSGLVKKIPTPALWNDSSELFSKPSALMIRDEPLDHS